MKARASSGLPWSTSSGFLANGRSRAAITATVMAAGMAVGVTPARAQVPKIDFSAIANAAETVTSLSKQLTEVTTIARTFTSSLTVQQGLSAALGKAGVALPDIGGGSVGDLISTAQLGLQTMRDAKATSEQIVYQVRSLLTDPLGTLSALTSFSGIWNDPSTQVRLGLLNVGADITGINRILHGTASAPDSILSLRRTLYLPMAMPSEEETLNVNGVRRATGQSTAVSAMAASATTTQAYTLPNDAMAALSAGIANATTERGDWKANSAVLLKLVEQSSETTALLAHLTQVKSGDVVAHHTAYGPDAPTERLQ